jgi:hypothetical protein
MAYQEEVITGLQRVERKKGDGEGEKKRSGAEGPPIPRHAVRLSFLSDQSPALQEVRIPPTETSSKFEAAERRRRRRRRRQ